MVLNHALFMEGGGSAFQCGSVLQQDSPRDETSRIQETASMSSVNTIRSISRISSSTTSQPAIKAKPSRTPIYVLKSQVLDNDKEIPAICLTPSSPPSATFDTVRYPGFLAPPLPENRKNNRRRRQGQTKESSKRMHEVEEDEEFRNGRKLELRSSKPSNIFALLTGNFIRKKAIQDIVRLVTQKSKTFPFCQEYDQASVQTDYRSMMIELCTILRFGNPLEFLAPVDPHMDLIGSVAHSSTIQQTHSLSAVTESLQETGSYATFPISNDLIIFARILSDHGQRASLSEVKSCPANLMLLTTYSPQLEIAELLLCSTKYSENHADMFDFPVIGGRMLSCYLQVMAKTRVGITFSGWYKPQESNRRINRERRMGSLDGIAEVGKYTRLDCKLTEKTRMSRAGAGNVKETPQTTRNAALSNRTERTKVSQEHLSAEQKTFFEGLCRDRSTEMFRTNPGRL
ncbi:hypothetical protein VTL71DRAFT_12308 [Oculimacula yallundae]|uniref:Uncharacterized protein n=1 Tax=Oculimacula yallundae TaxID=86028 RepID=A0ABR4CM77_9HELO